VHLHREVVLEGVVAHRLVVDLRASEPGARPVPAPRPDRDEALPPTRGERRVPDVLNGSRKRRIAAGSGTTVQEINQLLRQYQQMRKLFKQVGKRGLGSLGSRLR